MSTTMALPVTALYATPLAGLFLVLSARVVMLRTRYRVPLGTQQRLVERAVRAHGNFAEYVPLALILLGLAEGLGLPGWWLHALGTALVAARVAHAWGISHEPDAMAWRVLGTALTFTVVGVAAAALPGLLLAGL
jgi:uncharacterized membrane protein YecN with MAPEG domain